MMTLATAWGYKKHIIIKKSFIDGIEFFKGEKLAETDLNEIVVSYSDHWAYNYLGEKVPFEQLHMMTQAPGIHWANHHFRNQHRSEENAIAGFNMISIDVDGGVSLDIVHDLMKEYKFLTYTTKRHDPNGEHRFRLMLPINYYLELDSEEYKEFMNAVMNWLPFTTDESANQRAKKWESFDGGTYHYNLEGEVLDATGNRNNNMIKYALALVDNGMSLIDVTKQVHAFNQKMNSPLTAAEIDSTVLITVAKRYQNP
jgi:hypothetical protein